MYEERFEVIEKNVTFCFSLLQFCGKIEIWGKFYL